MREELDVKARLRRDGLRILALGGGAVLVIGAILVLRARLGGGRTRKADEPVTYADLAAELQEIRKAIEKNTKKEKGGSMPQKLLLRAVGAAGAAAGSMAARQMLARQAAVRHEETTPARAG